MGQKQKEKELEIKKHKKTNKDVNFTGVFLLLCSISLDVRSFSLEWHSHKLSNP